MIFLQILLRLLRIESSNSRSTTNWIHLIFEWQDQWFLFQDWRSMIGGTNDLLLALALSIDSNSSCWLVSRWLVRTGTLDIFCLRGSSAFSYVLFSSLVLVSSFSSARGSIIESALRSVGGTLSAPWPPNVPASGSLITKALLFEGWEVQLKLERY